MLQKERSWEFVVLLDVKHIIQYPEHMGRAWNMEKRQIKCAIITRHKPKDTEREH